MKPCLTLKLNLELIFKLAKEYLIRKYVNRSKRMKQASKKWALSSRGGGGGGFQLQQLKQYIQKSSTQNIGSVAFSQILEVIIIMNVTEVWIPANWTVWTPSNNTDHHNVSSSPPPSKINIWGYDLWLHQLLSYYLMWLVVVVGVLGNCLVIAVMRHKTFNKRPLSVYLTAIAISDSVMLVLAGK